MAWTCIMEEWENTLALGMVVIVGKEGGAGGGGR